MSNRIGRGTLIAPIPNAAYRFSVAQFEQMIIGGIFEEDERVELLDGEIFQMTPINHPHAATVSKLEFIFREKLGRSAYIWAQQPIVLGERSRPQPDVTLLKWRDDFYVSESPTPQDVLLLIEVSDSTLLTDRERKRTAYARGGISDYWIVNLKGRKVEAYFDPDPSLGEYKSKWLSEGADAIPLPGGLQGQIGVSEIFR